MVTQQLIDFIKSQQALGKTEQEISQLLKNNGWIDADIESGLYLAKTGQNALAGQLPAATEIFSQAWNIYNQNFWKLLAIYIIPGTAWLVVAAVIASGLGISHFSHNFFSSILGIVIATIIVAAVIIGTIYVFLWGQAALIITINNQSQDLGIKESYQRARPLVYSYFNASLAAGLLMLLGFILFIIPGFIFWVWYSFAGIAAVIDALPYRQSLKQSKNLTKGRWGAVAWRLIFPILVSSTVTFATAAAGQAVNKQTGTVINAIVSILIAPLIMTYTVTLYNHLKSQKPQ